MDSPFLLLLFYGIIQILDFGEEIMTDDNIELIKRLSIISMFSDDDLMDLLVLKGGNALDIIHKIALRASKDIDFSIENEFSQNDAPLIEEKIRKVLKETFNMEGFEVFDIKLEEKPLRVSEEMKKFWGGYQVKFKTIESEKYKELEEDRDSLRRNALITGLQNKKTFTIDISKFEYCSTKKAYDLDGYTIYVYTPEMIFFEKIRAICQQMPEYRKIVPNPSQSARARDFFDIYTILENFKIDLKAKENIEMLTNIFKAKRVPLDFIGKIELYKEFHRSDFSSVKDTVKKGEDLKEFDFYFDYVIAKLKPLETFWVI